MRQYVSSTKYKCSLATDGSPKKVELEFIWHCWRQSWIELPWKYFCKKGSKSFLERKVSYIFTFSGKPTKRVAKDIVNVRNKLSCQLYWQTDEGRVVVSGRTHGPHSSYAGTYNLFAIPHTKGDQHQYWVQYSMCCCSSVQYVCTYLQENFKVQRSQNMGSIAQ